MVRNSLTGRCKDFSISIKTYDETFAFFQPLDGSLGSGKVKTMGVIRTSLLVLAIAVMLPSPPESRQKPHAQRAEAAPATEFVGAAIGAVVDLDPFCARQEGVCVTAGYLFGRLEAKAWYNIGLLYDWARSDHVGGVTSPLANQANADAIMTGSATRLPRRTGASHNTLRVDDLIPAWRGPRQSTKS
jgi:hypothetical protein